MIMNSALTWGDWARYTVRRNPMDSSALAQII